MSRPPRRASPALRGQHLGSPDRGRERGPGARPPRLGVGWGRGSDLTPGSWERGQLEAGTPRAFAPSVRTAGSSPGGTQGVGARGEMTGHGGQDTLLRAVGREAGGGRGESGGSRGGRGGSSPAVEAPSPAAPGSMWSSDLIPLQPPRAARRRPGRAGKALPLRRHPQARGTADAGPGPLPRRASCHRRVRRC